jgi:UDP-N-acetylglucosamine 1-carboxyvinyltransferase
MDKLLITGGVPLVGEIAISGAKNAALPLMATALMAEDGMMLDNLPRLADTDCMCALLNHLGVATHREGNSVSFSAAIGQVTDAPYDIVRKMRASVLVLGPLLARYGRGRVSLPGGCAIGTRPVDLHIMAMEALGAKVTLEEGYILAEAPNGLRGGEVVFDAVSVGATENAMMAAVLAAGESRLINAAREPEITDLANCLNAMGGKITGQGTDVITIEGITSLTSCRHRVVADRIEAGTFAIAAAITEGQVTLTEACPDHLTALFEVLAASGVQVDIDGASITITATEKPRPVDITTDPYPGFPTDLQAQFMALMTVASGTSQISETIFENRFMHVPELTRMGAHIQVNGGNALIRGVGQLTAAPVMATDLRASVSLVLAALKADGETTLQRVYHLDRGYHRLEEKLTACGAKIRRTKE